MRNNIMIVPDEIKKDINKWSGYISPSSKYARKNLKGLFMTNENCAYLVKELYSLITNKQYVLDNMPENTLAEMNVDDPTNSNLTFNNSSKYRNINKVLALTVGKKDFLQSNIKDLVHTYKLPDIEEIPMQNPVLQLSSVNLNFLVEMSKNIINNISNIDPGANRINPDTNKMEVAEFDYDPSSYSDGVWKPEDLFVNCQRNRDNPYWIPLEIDFVSEPNAKGPGHRYNNSVYGHDHPQFPLWQTTVNRRYYDGDNTLGLKDGGNNDRRVQRPNGYNTAGTRF